MMIPSTTLDELAAKAGPGVDWRQVLRAFADLKPEMMHVVIKPGFRCEAEDIDGNWGPVDPVLFPRVFRIGGRIHTMTPDGVSANPDRTRAEWVLQQMMLADTPDEPILPMGGLADLTWGYELRTVDRLSPSQIRFTHEEVQQILDRLSQTEPANPGDSHKNPANQNQAIPCPTDESWRNDSSMNLAERRARAISWVIHKKEYDRFLIEPGDKGQILELCRHLDKELFRPVAAFERAWKFGSKHQWWKSRDHEKYVKNRF